MALARTRVWSLYDSAKGYIQSGTINLQTHAFMMAALGSGYDPSVSADTVRADLATHVVGADQTATLSLASSNQFTQISLSAPVQFSGSIAPRYWVLYDDTPTSPADPLVCVVDMGSAQTVPSGATFTVKDT